MKKKINKKEKTYDAEVGFDGDTDECQLIISLGTKNEKQANRLADKIIKALSEHVIK